jgi:hypothetical protein
LAATNRAAGDDDQRQGRQCMRDTTRRSALAAGVSIVAAGLICPRLAGQNAPASRPARNEPDKGTPVDPALIK